MRDIPERIGAWPFNPGWGGYWRENPDAVKREDGGAIYVRADLAAPLDAMTLERAAQVARESWADEDAEADPDWTANLIRALAPEPAEVTAARVLLAAQQAAMAKAGSSMTEMEVILANIDTRQLRAIVEAGK